jgi:outer membrane protein
MKLTKPMMMNDSFYGRLGKLPISWWLLLLIAVTPLEAQPLLTLTEAVQRVLTHNFDIQIARNEQKIAAKNYHMGRAGFLPSLDTHFGLHQEHTVWPQKQNADAANLSAGLGLKWTVFNGMQRIFTCQHLEKVSQIHQLATQKTIEDKVAEAITGYYRLALAQKKKQVLENCLAVSKEVSQLTKAKYEVGQCSKLEYLNAQVQYNEEQAKLLLQEEECTVAKLALRSLLGQEGPEDFMIEAHIPLPSRLSWEALTEASATVNTSIRIAQKHCEDATLAIKLKQADLWPSVDLSLGYSFGSRHHDQHWESTPGVLRYGISMRFNLFHAFQHTTAIQEAGIKADNAQLHLRAQQMQLEAELQKHFSHYTQQLKRCELAQQHMQVSQENVALALAQYRLGVITVLALDKATQNAQETTLKNFQAIYDAKVTEVELQKLGGILLDAAY